MTASPHRTKMVAFGQQIGKWKTSPPANSIATIELALMKRFDVVELDVRVSRDGVAVLAHDDLLKGSDGEIRISETDVANLLKFRIGVYEEIPQYIVTLSSALIKAREMDVLIDPRAKPNEYFAIRSAVENAGFDPSKLLFCTYGKWQAQSIKDIFPESTSLYKIARHFCEVNPERLDEIVALEAHGVMLFRPTYTEDFSGFMKELQKRNLQVLFYVHGGWPKPPSPDSLEESLNNMVNAGVEYVTTIACDTAAFKTLVGLES